MVNTLAILYLVSMFLSLGYWYYDNKKQAELSAIAARSGGVKYGSVSSIAMR